MTRLYSLNYFSHALVIFIVVLLFMTFSATVNAERVTDGLIALYDFEELSGTTVHDVSQYGDPLDLRIIEGHLRPGHVEWISGGLKIGAPSLIESNAGEAAKILDALSQTNEITIEAWVRPANDTQGDKFNPAQIVTVASGDNVNLELYQIDKEYGGYVNLILRIGDRVNAADTSSPGTLQHVVYTNSDASGTANLYIDDVHVKSVDYSSNMFRFDPDYPFAIANRPQAVMPWLGEIHLAAIYDRALTFVEIDQNYLAGPNPVSVPEPSTLTLLALAVLFIIPILRYRS